jgi:phage shock protein A
VEDELASVGENMKQLEKSAEEAVEREEKLKDRILQLQQKYKAAEARFEYGEMKITKLNHKVLYCMYCMYGAVKITSRNDVP